jgi:hypothetical protein
VDRRRLLALSAFAAIVLAGIDWQYLLLPFVDRSGLAAHARREADREWYPLYPRFLNAVRANTKPGQSIAIVVPPRRWTDGYDFAFYRASYFLAGRTVLPVLDQHDALHPENLQEADCIAVWQQPFRAPDRTLVWRGEGGVLLGRR